NLISRIQRVVDLAELRRKHLDEAATLLAQPQQADGRGASEEALARLIAVEHGVNPDFKLNGEFGWQIYRRLARAILTKYHLTKADGRGAVIEALLRKVRALDWAYDPGMSSLRAEVDAVLSQAPATDGAKLPPYWKQDQTETSRLAPSHTRPDRGAAK